MFSIIIETIASTLAETFASRAAEKGSARHPRLFGWLGIIVIVAITVGMAVLGIYLIIEGVWPISILMFAISAFMLYILVVPIVRKIKSHRQ